MNNYATKLFRASLLLASIFLLSASPLFAQATGKLIGKVTDSRSGSPLIGANVYLLGTIYGAATDIDGIYKIDVPAGTYELRVNYVSYKTSTIEVKVEAGKTVTQDFAMSQDYIGGNEVVVLGTRRSGRTVVESPVPIDVIGEEEIRSTGLSQTTQILQQLIPSYNAPQPSITDGSDHMRPATLRGLGPDQVLILVNGKRRHTSALVHVNGSVGRGSTGADLNAIPSSAIERIEVLRDGAAAQYGSDAISGVINIVLKEKPGLDVSVNYSQYASSVTRGYSADEGLRDGENNDNYSWSETGGIGAEEDVSHSDGQAVDLHLGYGVPVGKGSFYASGQFRTRDRANRAGLDPRQQYIDGSEDPREAGFDRLNHRYGNGEFDNVSLFINGAVPIGESSAQFYAFGGYNYRNGATGCFYRRSLDNRTVRAIHPDGFLPLLDNTLKDLSASAGVKGSMGEWAYDLSAVYGTNSFNFGVDNTNNASFGTTIDQTTFDAGTLKFRQMTTNFDLFRGVDIGTASPLNVAIGAEFRADNYQIEPGEPTSYQNGGEPVLDGPNAGSAAPVGSSCFPGFGPANETDTSRTNFGVYVDLENNLTPALLLGVAARFENYSDFGSTSTFKVASRVSVSPEFALRGAFSTGFRAPSLAQTNYSAIATNFIDGVPFEVGTFPVHNPVARALGAEDLEAETSVNISAGASVSVNNFSLTADVYQIDINDRIVFTENFTGGGIPDFLATQGINANGGRFFTNAVETRTQGLDITGRLGIPLENGSVRFTLAANFNDTEITNKDEIETPALLQEFTSTALFGRTEIGRFEVGQPDSKINFTVNYDVSVWRFMLRVQRYGEVTDLNSGAPDPDTGINNRDETFSAKVISDLEVGRKLADGVNLAIGANNLLDTYPDKQLKVNSFNGIFPYDGLSPFGFFGRSVYARLGVSL